jgi:hypothetical protein
MEKNPTRFSLYLQSFTTTDLVTRHLISFLLVLHQPPIMVEEQEECTHLVVTIPRSVPVLASIHLPVLGSWTRPGKAH